jgi:hypothetical protein
MPATAGLQLDKPIGSLLAYNQPVISGKKKVKPTDDARRYREEGKP